MNMLAQWRPESLWMAVLSTLLFGGVGIVLMMLGFKIFDWITPKLDVEKELAENHNIAVAIVLASVFLGISAIIACVLMT